MPDRSPRRRRRCTTAASPTSCTDARPACRRPRSRPAGRRTCTPAPPATVPGRRRAEGCCRRRSSRPDCRRRRSCRPCRCSCRSVPRCQLPFASQVSGVFTSHRRSPGMQSVASRPTASTEPPPSFWVDPSGLFEPAVPGPPLAPTATGPRRTRGAAPAPCRRSGRARRSRGSRGARRSRRAGFGAPRPGGVIVVDGVDRSARRRAHHGQQPSDAGKFGQPFRYHQAHR